MKNTQKRLVLCRREAWMGGLRCQLELRGDVIGLDVKKHTVGFLCLPAIDSGAAGFSWKRVKVDCRLPEGSTLRVYAWACDSKGWGPWQDLDEALPNLKGDYDELRRALEPLFGRPVSRGADFLANRRGRYLWLMLELMSSGAQDPEIDGISLWMEGDHMADYLPACYQGDDFTRRFLSPFNSMLLDMEEQICAIPGLLDVETTGEELLRHLSAWVCMDAERASPEELRRWIPTALDDYESMYTVEGVKRSVERLTGREPIVIEHCDVDPNSPRCADPALHRRLYGDDPYKFFVLLEEDTFSSRDKIEDFLEQMKVRVPAGLELELILLKKCIQLDWHTYLGVNSVVGSYVPATIDENTTIHFDTVIGG